jgi:hypothetical protein
MASVKINGNQLGGEASVKLQLLSRQYLPPFSYKRAVFINCVAGMLGMDKSSTVDGGIANGAIAGNTLAIPILFTGTKPNHSR